MSELKVYHCNEWHNEYTEFYLKFEADKAIADLEESHKMEVSQLLVANMEQAVNSNRLRDSMEQAIRSQKYKRCFAMVRLCATSALYEKSLGAFEYFKWWWKWYERWKKLAEQFNEEK